jgi:CubicO group peptidase (beta-lactamase class C family)
VFGRREFLAGATALGLTQAASAGVLSGGPRDAAIDAFVTSQHFQGVILIATAGKPVFSRAIGLADIAAQRPATLDTPYAVASISKWLTSIAVLRLVDVGRLDLDAPITRYLPDYRADTGAKVTLRRLMSNTSGVPNGFTLAAKADPDLFKKTFSTAEAVKQWCSGDLAFEPGTKFDYALTNWVLIYAVVEAVTGKPFAEAMTDLVIGPLGLSRTTPVDSPGMAASYRTVEPLVPQSNIRFACMAAGGGYVSTAADLSKAAHKVFDGGFLPPARLRELMTVAWPDESYALGGRVKTLFVDGMPRVFAWETGRAAGYRSVLAHRFDDQTTVVLLNNTSITQKAMDEFAYALLGTV